MKYCTFDEYLITGKILTKIYNNKKMNLNKNKYYCKIKTEPRTYNNCIEFK